MIRYYITDRAALGGVAELMAHLDRTAEALDYVQIRERDLTARDLTNLTEQALKRVGRRARVLVNDRVDIALACGCAGVHLRSGSVAPSLIRRIVPTGFTISVSCHSVDDVKAAEQEGADLALLAPIFETPNKGPELGLKRLAEAASAVSIPVLALGGVTESSAAECLRAGAAGIAGIRLFQDRGAAPRARI